MSDTPPPFFPDPHRLRRQGGNLTFTDLPTYMLVPASPGEFDQRCTYASNNSCSLLAPWDKVGDASTWSGVYYPAGYAASLWKPAGLGDWFALRYGMQVSTVYNYGDVGDNATYAGNLLYALESDLEASNQVPFYGLTDRVWAIDNATVNITLPDLLDTVYTLTDGYQGGALPYWINNRVRLMGARAFAYAGASDRRSGPAGVVLSSRDYRGVLAGTCERLTQVSGYSTTDHNLRFNFDYAHDFALQCPIKPLPWVAQAFPTAVSAAGAQPLTIQCPAYPYMFGSSKPGIFDVGKPDYPRCGLSTTPSIYFSGDSGTETTCCFERINGACCSDKNLPVDDPDQYSSSRCNRYRYANAGSAYLCRDMQECVGGGRLEWPFLQGASLATSRDTNDSCFKVPAPGGTVSLSVLRLPVLDIRTIPLTLSPFTQQPYCTRDG